MTKQLYIKPSEAHPLSRAYEQARNGEIELAGYELQWGSNEETRSSNSELLKVDSDLDALRSAHEKAMERRAASFIVFGHRNASGNSYWFYDSEESSDLADDERMLFYPPRTWRLQIDRCDSGGDFRIVKNYDGRSIAGALQAARRQMRDLMENGDLRIGSSYDVELLVLWRRFFDPSSDTQLGAYNRCGYSDGWETVYRDEWSERQLLEGTPPRSHHANYAAF